MTVNKKYVKLYGGSAAISIKLLRDTSAIRQGFIIYISSSKNLSQLGNCDGSQVLDRAIITGNVKNGYPNMATRNGHTFIFTQNRYLKPGSHRYVRS